MAFPETLMPTQRPGWLLVYWVASFASVWLLLLPAQRSGLSIAFDIVLLIHTLLAAASGACGWWLGMLDWHSKKSVLVPLATFFFPIAIGIMWTILQSGLAAYAPLQMNTRWELLPIQIASLSEQIIDVAWTTSILFFVSRASGVYLVRANVEPRAEMLTVRSMMIATLCIAAATATWKFVPQSKILDLPGTSLDGIQDEFLLFNIGFKIKAAILWAVCSLAMSVQRKKAIWIALAFASGTFLSLLYGSLFKYWWMQVYGERTGVSTKYMTVGYVLISTVVFMCGIFAVIAIANRCGFRLVRVQPHRG
jgi:hypothetical protein